MSSEMKSVSEDSNMTDYANLAFNPYATSTDDLSSSTFGKGEPVKNGKSMENGGFEPEHFVEVNPHYEDTAEVIEKAGLGGSGTGRRKKENIVYEAAGFKKKTVKSEKRPEPPQLRASNIPPRPPEDWSGLSKNTNNTRWKMPFVILCLLVLICLVGTAFGVLAYFKDEKCSCGTITTNHLNSEQQQQKPVVNDTTSKQISEIKMDLKMIFATLDHMNATLNELQRGRQTQEDKLIRTNASINMVRRQLNSVIQAVNSTLNIKLQNVSNNISSLTTDVEKLRNISKQMGPRGFNGTQGPQGVRGIQGLQGEPGIGNVSACRVKEKFQKGQTDSGGFEKVIVDYDTIPGWKVISAVCTTRENAGTIHTVLSLSNNRYKCTCAGPSTYSVFTPKIASGAKEKELDCGIIYWECPVV